MAFKPYTPPSTSGRDASWGFGQGTSGVGVSEWAKAEPIINPALTPDVAMPEPPKKTIMDILKFSQEEKNIWQPSKAKAVDTFKQGIESQGKGYTTERIKSSALEQLVSFLNIPKRFTDTMQSVYDVALKDNKAYQQTKKMQEKYESGFQEPSKIDKMTETLNQVKQNVDFRIAGMEASGGVTKFEKGVGDVAAVIPQQVGLVLEQVFGIPLGTLNIVSSSIGQAGANATDKEMISAGIKGVGSAIIERLTMMFAWLSPLKKATGMTGGFIANFVAKKTASSAPIVKALAQLLVNAGGEGAEEVLDTWMQEVVDWRILNPNAPMSSFANWQTVKESGYAGIIGSAAGALLGAGKVINDISQAPNKPFVQAIAKDVAMIPANESTEPESIDKIERLQHVVAGLKVDPTASVPSLIVEYEQQKTAESTQMPLEQPTSDSDAEIANIITPAVESVPSAVAEPTMASEQVNLTNAEIISTKTSTGNIYKVGNKVYKPATFKDGTPTIEGEVYNALSGVDGVSEADVVTIDGKEYIVTPLYPRVVSIDDVPKDQRKKYERTIIDNADRITRAVEAVSNAGYVYSDPLQFGHTRDTKMNLMDFSNASKETGSTYDDNAVEDNYNRLSQFYDAFGLTKLSTIISNAIRYKGLLETNTAEEVKNKDVLMAEEDYSVVEQLKNSGGDLAPNNVYYATNGRHIGIADIAQTEPIDGVKYIYSEKAILPKLIDEWEMTTVYENKAVTPIAKPTQPTPQPTVAKKETVAPKRTLSQAIDDIANNATSITDATKQMNALLDSDDSILDELGDKIKNKADFNDELHKLLRETRQNTVDKNDESDGYKRWNGIVNLQLLAMKRFAQRLEDVPKDSRAYSFMKHMVEYMGKTVDDDAMASLESELDEIFYEQLHNVDVVDNAKSIINIQNAKNKNKKLEALYKKLTVRSYTTDAEGDVGVGEVTLLPHEMVALGMWARELTTSDNAEDVIKASNIIRKISNRMTVAGQFTQAARALYEVLYPEMMAKRIIKEVDNQNSPIANEDLQNQVKKLLEVINRYRSDANKYAIKDVENMLKDYGDFNAFADTENPAEMLKRKIEYDLKQVEPKERTELNKMISTLFQIYKETNKKEAKATNAYEAITEMVLNRERYAKVWDRAKELMLERGAYEPQLVEYINRLADPTLTKSIMNKVISQTFKEMGKTPTDLARAYFVSDGANVDEFVDILRTQVPNLDDASFKYLSDALKTRFQQQMEERRLKLIEALGKQYDTSGNRIITKEKQGVKERTINQLIDASFKRALDIDSINTAWAQRMGLSVIDADTKQKIYDTMKQIAKIEDEEQREIAFDNLLKEIAGKLSGTNYEKFLAWRRASMLFSPVSWIKNGLSNMASLPFYKMTDKIETIMNNIAGEDISADRRIAGEKLLKAGVNAEIDDAVARFSTKERINRMVASSSKYTIGKIISAEKRIFKNSKLEQFTKLPYHAMSTGKIDIGNVDISIPFIGDQYMFTRHFTTAMRNRLNAINYSEITNEQDRATAEKKAADEAFEVAIIRTYRKVSQIAHKIQSMKNSMHLNDTVKQRLAKGDVVGARRAEKIGDMLNAVIDIAVPFVVTPVAIAEEAYKFSPINGFIQLASLAGYQIKKSQLKKAGIEITPEMSAKLSSIHHGLAQAISGTAGQFLVGVIFGMMGLLTGSPPDNEKERLEWMQQGKRAYSIYLKGFGSLSLDWMQPVSMVLGMGAELGQQMANNDYSLSGMGNAMVSSVDALFKNSIVSDLQSTFGGGYNTSLTSTVGQFIVDGAFQGLPGIARRLSRVFDQYERDIYTGNSFNVIKNRVLSHIPFASMTIPPKVDIWGNPIKQKFVFEGLVPRIIGNLLSPFIYQGADRDALTVEVSRLFESTDKSEALPIVPNDNLELTYKNKKYTETLVGNEWLDYQKLLGSKQYEYANLVIQSAKYANATDEKRVEYIRKAYLLASTDAKEEYIKKKYNLP